MTYPYFIGVAPPAAYSGELFHVTGQMSIPNGCLSNLCWLEYRPFSSIGRSLTFKWEGSEFE